MQAAEEGNIDCVKFLCQNEEVNIEETNRVRIIFNFELDCIV